MGFLKRIVLFVERFEDLLLVTILSSMIVLAAYQIISRNILDQGVVWIDPLLRILVLWVGLAGAVVATRNNHHIRIDVFTKYFPAKLLPYIDRLVYLFTFSICLLITWHAMRFVISEYEYSTIAFASVPAWAAASIIPVSFLLIAIRYGIFLFRPPPRINHDGIDVKP